MMPDDVPWRLWAGTGEAGEAALAELCDLSLVTRTSAPGGDGVSMHRVLRDVLRADSPFADGGGRGAPGVPDGVVMAWIRISDEGFAMLNESSGLLDSATSPRVRMFPHLQELLLGADAASADALVSALGVATAVEAVDAIWGIPIAAADNGVALQDTVRVAEAVVALARSVLRVVGPGSAAGAIEASSAMIALGYVLRRSRRFDEAEATILEGLALRRRVHGASDHGTIVDALFNLASLYTSMGRRDDAESLLVEALGMVRRAKSRPSCWSRYLYSGTATIVMCSLGWLYFETGRLAEAEALLVEAADLQRVSPSNEFKDGLSRSLNPLGLTYQRQGKLEDARRALEEALAIARRKFGAHDAVDLSVCIGNLAQLLLRLGDVDAAAPLFMEELAMARRLADGHDNCGMAAALNNVAKLLFRQGKYDEARPLFDESLAMSGRLSASGAVGVGRGLAYANWARTIHNLALLDAATGALDAADRGFAAAVTKGREAHHGHDDVNTAESLYHHGAVLARRGRLLQSVTQLQAAVDMYARLALADDGGADARAARLLLRRVREEDVRDVSRWRDDEGASLSVASPCPCGGGRPLGECHAAGGGGGD